MSRRILGMRTTNWSSLSTSRPSRTSTRLDRGEYEWSVNYQSYDPVDWENPTSAEKEILKTRAYIDMPNIRAVSFLDPRDMIFGITVHF